MYNRNITSWVNLMTVDLMNLKFYQLSFLLLNQGVEGIAVGLSTKILPHNFNELLDASIKIIRGKSTRIYPDFYSGGFADFHSIMMAKKVVKLE